MLNRQTVERLHEMRLFGMAEALARQLERPDSAELSFEERIKLLVEYEWTYRLQAGWPLLLRQARLRLSACLEDIDYRYPRGLDRGLLKSLGTCQWIHQRQNVLITGPTGVGKTFIACALANAAWRQGLSARYYRTPRLLQDLALARGDGTYPPVLGQLARISLLVLDDWGLAPVSETQARDLLEAMDGRYNVTSTIVVCQVPVEHWHGLLPDPTIAEAVLDRLLHNAFRIALRGESMRKVLHQNDQSGK